MQGWIKLHRCLMYKPIWQESTPEQKVILTTLLMMANHQGKEWEWKGERYTAEPGQFITSLDSIAYKCGKGITVQNVRTALKRFEKYEFLTNESTNKNRLITIVNWGVYQGFDDEPNKQDNKQLTSNQQATNKQLTTNKNVKNEKNEKNVKKNIYAEFVKMTSDEYEKLLEQFGESGVKDRIERLNLYKGSTGKKYKSDYLTILNWERKNKGSGKPNGQHKEPTQYDNLF
jgi:hypothetical protein